MINSQGRFRIRNSTVGQPHHHHKRTHQRNRKTQKKTTPQTSSEDTRGGEVQGVSTPPIQKKLVLFI